MWQPSWSPHPPPGAHGAPLGPPAGTVAPPPQGVQPHTMVVAQPMNQQWMGNPTGSQGCPGNPSTLASSPFYGPGPQGQGFVVQCKHHQGSFSIMQHQQPMLGTTSSSSPPCTHGIWPWPSTSRISRNYVVIFSYVHSSISTSSTTTIGYLLQPTGTQPIAVTFTSTSLVYKLPTPAEPILPAPTKTMPPNQHTCDYQPNGSQSSRCTRSTRASRCTRSTSSSSSSTSSRFSWSSKCP